MNKFINLTVVKLTTHYNWYKDSTDTDISKIRQKNTEFHELEGWTIELTKYAKNRIDNVSDIELENYLKHPQFVNTFVSIDELAQIETVPQNLVIYKNKNKYKIVPIYRLTVKSGRGCGINGIDHDMYITEDSFKKLTEILG